MNRPAYLWRASLSVAVVLAAGSVGLAQRDPTIGYVYPAGGQQGTVVEVAVGGQYLDGVTGAYVSGGGVTTKIIKHNKPLSNKQLNDLRNKLRDLQKQAQNARKKDPKSRAVLDVAAFNAYAKSIGLKEMTFKAFVALRRRMADPKRQLNPQISESVLVQITLAADAEPGPRDLRLITPRGITVPVAFQVGRYPEYREVEPNDRTAAAGGGASLPVVINGQVLPGDVDRFRFKARKGMHLVAAASARALIPYLADAVPGWFQATLTLTDAAGREVAYCDDFRFHPDPVLFCEIPADGEYVLEIKDSIFRGREDFVYRITLGEVPFVTSLFPLGGPAGAKTTVAVSGWNLPTSTLTVRPGRKRLGVLPVVVSKGGQVSNPSPFAVDTLPECREKEGNDNPRDAQLVKLPQVVNGRIDHPGDKDVFRFTARAGDEIVAEVLARRLGSPVDSLLVLTDAAGKPLAVNDDHDDKGAGLETHHADSLISVKLPADGTYLLYLSDTQHKGGSEYGYRLRLSPRRPDFALRVVPSSLTARSGAYAPVTVYALRKDGFDGDIALALLDAPDGMVLNGGGIPAGQDRARLTLRMPVAPTGEQPHLLHLEGRATIAGRPIVREAVPAEDRMQAFLWRHLVPANDWMVAVAGPERKWAPRFKALSKLPVKIPAGGEARVRLSGPRVRVTQKFEFELDDPPAGVSVKSSRVALAELRITLSADAKKVRPGFKDNLIVNVYTYWTGHTKDGKARPRRRVLVGTLPAIPIEIVASPGEAVAKP